MDLAKAAGSVIRSDELAELMGWLPGPSAKADTGKLALLRKLAAMEAELDKAAGEQWFEDLKLARALDPDIGMLKRACAMCGGMAQGLSGMSNLKITLPLPVFLKLIMGDTLDESHAACASRRGPSLFRDMLQAPDLPDILGDGDYEVAAPLGASRSLEGLREGFSLEPGPARRRIMIAVIRGVRKPEGKAPPADDVEKAAAETAGLVMAREYGKYLLASLKDQDDQVRRMALAQNRAP
jgi:hypothetical protein